MTGILSDQIIFSQDGGKPLRDLVSLNSVQLLNDRHEFAPCNIHNTGIVDIYSVHTMDGIIFRGAKDQGFVVESEVINLSDLTNNQLLKLQEKPGQWGNYHDEELAYRLGDRDELEFFDKTTWQFNEDSFIAYIRGLYEDIATIPSNPPETYIDIHTDSERLAYDLQSMWFNMGLWVNVMRINRELIRVRLNYPQFLFKVVKDGEADLTDLEKPNVPKVSSVVTVIDEKRQAEVCSITCEDPSTKGVYVGGILVKV